RITGSRPHVTGQRDHATQAPGPWRGRNPLWGPDGAAEDTALLRAVAAGDAASLTRLYERRGGPLYSMLVRMLGSKSEAEDVLQETFVRIWQKAGEFHPARSAPFTWMVMVARGLALSRLRARGRFEAGLSAYEREVASLEVEQVHDGWRFPDS